MKNKCFPNNQTSCEFGEESKLWTKSFGGGCVNQIANSLLNVCTPNYSKHVDAALNPCPPLRVSSPRSREPQQQQGVVFQQRTTSWTHYLSQLTKELMATSPSQAPNGLHITPSAHLKDCLGASPQHLMREGWRPKNNGCVSSMWFIATGNYVYRAPSGDPICALYEQKLKSTHIFLWTQLWTAHT